MRTKVTVKAALQNIVDHPQMVDDDLLQKPVHELICRNLFELANNPDSSARGSLARANKARKLIFDRLVGKRRAGSHPATRNAVEIEFIDLTGGELE